MDFPDPPAELAELSERLCRKVRDVIKTEGPISFSRYMDLVLYEPGLGYYRNGLVRFGRDGDFVTAPELGQVFARALSARINDHVQPMGESWNLLEIGAGSGVLARDLLGSLRRLPEQYWILETSGELRDRQKKTLKALPEDLRRRVVWLDGPPEEDFNGVIVANEVLDALPVERFRVTAEGFQGLAVDWENDGFVLRATRPSARLAAGLERLQQDLGQPLPEGFQSEICTDLSDWLQAVTGGLKWGAVLLFDYGYPRREYYLPERAEGTLVCQYRHRAHFDPFFRPGLCDVSSFVDFTAVAEAADQAGLSVDGFTSQAWFVLTSGVLEDMAREQADPMDQVRLSAEIRQLTLPGEMGEKFKFMALGRGLDAGLGLEPGDQLHRL